MMRCDDYGALRAYLDDALPAAERAAVATHLTGCPACRTRLEELRVLAQRAGALLAAPPAAPDPHAALARLRAASALHSVKESEPQLPLPRWRRPMQTASRFWSGPRRSLFAGLVTIVVLVSLLALPPVRAAADSFLNIFRAQSVVFVPISRDRIEQLQGLNFDPQKLFLEKPNVTSNPGATRTVGTAGEASGIAGFTVEQPAAFLSAPTSQEFIVRDRGTVEFKLNVAAARELLALMQVNDVSLPDGLGTAPIVADIPAFVQTRYRGEGYDLSLFQGRSPSVQVPDGVDLAQLGKAALRILGVEPAQAEAMSRAIDWENTLLFPFPSDIGNIRQVTINGTPGLLVGGQQSQPERARSWQLYWQNGDHIYMLEGRGRIGDADVIATAESIR